MVLSRFCFPCLVADIVDDESACDNRLVCYAELSSELVAPAI